jgi:hypothetical protein
MTELILLCGISIFLSLIFYKLLYCKLNKSDTLFLLLIGISLLLIGISLFNLGYQVAEYELVR